MYLSPYSSVFKYAFCLAWNILLRYSIWSFISLLWNPNPNPWTKSKSVEQPLQVNMAVVSERFPSGSQAVVFSGFRADRGLVTAGQAVAHCSYWQGQLVPMASIRERKSLIPERWRCRNESSLCSHLLSTGQLISMASNSGERLIPSWSGDSQWRWWW